jgi:vacuolar-type H+-ATPase subunit E/Vma4
MSSELIALLERESKAEQERIVGEARQRAAQIVNDAKAEAEQMVATAAHQLEQRAAAARMRAEGTGNLRAASVLLQVKDEEIARVFAAARQHLESLTTDSARYERLLRGLLAEAARGFQGPVEIECAEADVARVDAAARALGVSGSVRPSRDVSLGVRVRGGEGRRFVVENTLVSRLERAQPMLTSAIADLLWK